MEGSQYWLWRHKLPCCDCCCWELTACKKTGAWVLKFPKMNPAKSLREFKSSSHFKSSIWPHSNFSLQILCRNLKKTSQTPDPWKHRSDEFVLSWTARLVVIYDTAIEMKAMNKIAWKREQSCKYCKVCKVIPVEKIIWLCNLKAQENDWKLNTKL
jgi:hypothetical protein